MPTRSATTNLRFIGPSVGWSARRAATLLTPIRLGGRCVTRRSCQLVTTIAQVTARRASRSISSRPTSGDAALDHVFMNRPTRLFIGAFAFAGALGLAGLLAFAWTGVSARNAPSAFEAWAARSARHLLIPASARVAATPLAASPELLERAEGHLAAHRPPRHRADGPR